MLFLQPETLDEALAARAAHPEALPIAGGTDVCVALNLDHGRPQGLLDLTRLTELRHHHRDDGSVVLGAGVNYTRLITELSVELPGLALASRSVGSPQIRNRGTVGGNLGTASPAGDALPPLVAAGATVEVASLQGRRDIAVSDFVLRPKHSALRPDELIVAVRIPVARGPQQFAKIGTRNAMVIAVAAFALAIDTVGRTVGTGIGSAGPVPLTADAANDFLSGVFTEGGLWERPEPLADSAITRFGELVGDAAQPIDDVRGTAAYRRHALQVLARRTLTWAWAEHLEKR